MNPPPTTPVSAPAPADGAWPRSAQVATAVLLLIAAVLLVLDLRSRQASAARPSTLARVDLNRASRAELRQLPGVGPKLADRIEAKRRDGGFADEGDLDDVRGVGPATLRRLTPLVAAGFSGDEEEAELPSNDSRAPKKVSSLSERVDLNRAGVADLQRLPGVGPKLAQAIVDERSRQPFRAVDDLRRVRGIGPKTLDKIRPYATVDDPYAATRR